jgi:hypothetical protein
VPVTRTDAASRFFQRTLAVVTSLFPQFRGSGRSRQLNEDRHRTGSDGKCPAYARQRPRDDLRRIAGAPGCHGEQPDEPGPYLAAIGSMAALISS